jgi:hypothetical protein
MRELMILNKLRRIDQKIRLVAGKLRFFPCRINGGIARTMEKEDRIGRTTACGSLG